MAFTKEQIDELAIAQNRVQSGTPGVATDTNAGDVANLNYAATKIGQSNVDNIQDIAKIGTGSPLVPTTQPVSDGTDNYWDQYNKNSSDLGKNVQDLQNDQPSSTSVLDQLAEQRAKIGQFTSQQEADIKAAGEAAAAQYNDQLEQAQYDRKTGLPQDVVRAGSRGGFENTQIAGTAAVRGTSDANGAFVGAGGMLDESRQAMDRNISVIVNAQKQAALTAESKYREYLRTGQESDYNAAMDLVKLSQDMENDKATIKANQDRLEQSAYQFERTEGRLGASAQVGIDKDTLDIMESIPDGESRVINGKTYQGIAVEDVDQFWNDTTTLALMKSVPVGETKTFYAGTDKEITVTGTMEAANNNKIFEAKDQNRGVSTFTTLDQDGNIVKQVEVKTGDTYKPTASGSSNTGMNRLLTLAEQKAYGMGPGTTVQEAKDAGAMPQEDIDDKEAIKAEVKAIMGKDDKKLDTSKYEDLRGNVAYNNPELMGWFDATYAPTKWLNDNDPNKAAIVERWNKETGKDKNNDVLNDLTAALNATR